MIDRHLYGILTAVNVDYTEMMDTFIIIFMVTDIVNSVIQQCNSGSKQRLFKCSKEISFTKDWTTSITFDSRRCYLQCLTNQV